MLMQMLTPGRSSIYMRGMPVMGNIPECWGIHGAHQSGLEEARRYLERMYRRIHKPLEPFAYKPQTALGIEDGGIMISRPLLGFSKQELRQTCIENRMEWIEDQTNQDPTMTKRNAVRFLLKSGQLPNAVTKQGLLDLRESQEFRAQAIKSRASRLLKEVQIITFDARSGGMVIRLPKRTMGSAELPARVLKNNISEQVSRRKRWEARERVVECVRLLLAMVSPLERIDKKTLSVAVRSLFSDTFSPDEPPEDVQTKFTVAGVLCERRDAPLSGDGKLQRELKNLDHEYVWSLSRQPFQASRAKPLIEVSPGMADMDSPLRDESVLDQAPTESLATEPLDPGWTLFHLWDGRYWIRVKNQTQHRLLIRPFRQSDMSLLRAALSEERYSHLRAILAAAAPGPVRWTLPIIARPTSSANPSPPEYSPPQETTAALTSHDVPLCLPTLGKTLISPNDCLYEARFRKVDFGPHILSKPSNTKISELDFVVTRSEGETPAELKTRKQVEIVRANRAARNRAADDLYKIAKEHRMAVLGDELTELGGDMGYDSENDVSERQQYRNDYKLNMSEKAQNSGTQVREGSKADLSLYQQLNKDNSRTAADLSLREPPSIDEKENQLPWERHDGSLPHEEQWVSYTPRTERQSKKMQQTPAPDQSPSPSPPPSPQSPSEPDTEAWRKQEHWEKWF